MKQANDIELFRLIKQNQKNAFDELFRRYYTPLCRFAIKITTSEEKAEEAVQETFIHFWEQRQTLNVQQSVVAYLFRSVRLKVYEHFRSQQIKLKHEEEFSKNDNFITEDNNVELDNYQLACLIWNAVEQLPDKCGEIFKLSRDEGLTYNEIADHLGISAKTVENQMGIAFKKLREILYPALKNKGFNYFEMEVILLIIMSHIFNQQSIN